MKEWAKEVLLRYYIGAIVVAMLVVDGLNDVVRAITFPIALLLQERTPNVVRSTAWFMAAQFTANVLAAILLLAAAYFLARWLYGAPPTSTKETDDALEPEQPQGGVTV